MKRLMKIMGLPLLGMLLVVSGLAYDLRFAGLPYQDPTPDMEARWKFHKSVAGVFYEAGGVTLLAGVVAAPVIWMRTRPCRRRGGA